MKIQLSFFLLLLSPSLFALDPVPDKLVVLTFDDSVKSHYTVVRPILKKYGFNATFFITEGFSFKSNKKDYMTWKEIKSLHDDGFEIGNHTRDHIGVTDQTYKRLSEQLTAIEKKCKEYGIPRPTTFAWPGNATTEKAFKILREHGIQFARRGGSPEYPYTYGRGVAYEPNKDHPLFLPSAGDARPDWNMADLVRAVEQAKDGKIAILQFHGAPDNEHPWVHTPKERFASYMEYLHKNKYTVIALRDLKKYVDPKREPDDFMKIVKLRKKRIQEEELPEGMGFANKYPSDQGIQKHPSVIFSEDFEKPGYQKRWEEVRNKNKKVLSLIKNKEKGIVGKTSLRVTGNISENTGGGMTRWFKSNDTLFIRFYTRFNEKCHYVHHFVTLRANKSLQGRDKWSGFGGAGKKPNGHDRFSTALEPWGNWRRWPAPGRWNFYSYWSEMKPSRDGKYWGNAFRPIDAHNIKKEVWICCEFMIKHNTPGKADGEQAFWIDGKLQGHFKGIKWRDSKTLMANALTVEAYITNRWTQQQINIVDFDNIVVAKEYIGPTK